MAKKFLYVDSSGAYFESNAYETGDYINSSAGAGDAGKPIVLDAGGHIDASMINPFDIQGVFEWKNSVLDADVLTPPGSPSLGDRYLINGTGAGGWAGLDGEIVEWDGSAWVSEGTPVAGWAVSADDEQDRLYIYTGAAWSEKLFEATTASTGLTKVGVDVQLADASAADGILVSSGVISAVVDDSTIEINGSEQLAVKADGINDTHIDFGTGANQVSAVDIPITDAGGFTAETEVEGALQELYGLVNNSGVSYTVGVGGVAKGDPVYVSANDTVLPYDDISVDNRTIGLAFTTEAAAASVIVAANDTVITGILSGATAGDIYYWSGSAFTTTLPAGSGSFVWQVGIAKNATDLHVETRFIKKNS